MLLCTIEIACLQGDISRQIASLFVAGVNFQQVAEMLLRLCRLLQHRIGKGQIEQYLRVNLHIAFVQQVYLR
ncbi:MAG TPA: hypothetical protein VH599_04930 [Ktedonobacterales bacterium]